MTGESFRTVTSTSLAKKKKGLIPLTTLVLFSFSSAFFSRVLLLIKFPSIITLVYLVVIPAVTAFVLIKTRIKSRVQINAIQELFLALAIFFGINLASALLNNAGLINAFLNFLFFCEPFLFLAALIGLVITPERLEKIRIFIISSSFINLGMGLIQGIINRTGNPDYVKGVFIDGGAGHVLGASVSLTFGVYYFVAAQNRPLWFRAGVVLATLIHMNMADAKQALLVFLFAGVLLLILKLKNIVEAIKYFSLAGVFGSIFYWATQNIPALDGFNTWMRPEIYGPQGEATLLKTAAFRLVPTYFHSSLNPWLGLGPGHTVGRLGGWMLDKYADLLAPLGSTIHPASAAVWQAVGKSWLGDQSSMFSPLFGWAAIWGDLGWLGLFSFLYIWVVVWRRFCFDDVSKFLMLTPLVFGLIFTQMEEPGYMIYLVAIIGLRWLERQNLKQSFAQGQAHSKSL
jgi:hypothetical protein